MTKFYILQKVQTFFFALFATLSTATLFAQDLPNSNCGPSGGTQADIIAVQTAYRGIGGTAPTFAIPIGAQNATITISSHAGVIGSPSTQQTVNDEDFITITAVLDFTTNTSSGILNFARSTYVDSSESNLYTWLDVPFGVNVSSQRKEGQITSPPLNDVIFTLVNGVLTITETAADIQSSYLVEFTSPLLNSLTSTGVGGLFFIGGSSDLTQNFTIPNNTDIIIISKKGTVSTNNGGYTDGWEEGYADGRIILDIDLNRMDGFLTVANGGNLASRSTYVIENHTLSSTSNLTASGNVSGDYLAKTAVNAGNAGSVGLSDPAVYISGGELHITRQVGYAGAFDDVYLFEFYERTGAPMSASFIASRSTYIGYGQGSGTGTPRVIKIPTGSDFAVVRQAGNANNLNEHSNENPLAGYYFIDLKTEKAAGYFWQQVGFSGSSGRRDDNYGFANVPLDGQSTRDNLSQGSVSNGIYYVKTNPYDLSFTLSSDKSELTITNAFGEVPDKYKALAVATFYGKKTDLTGVAVADVDYEDYYGAINNGSCGGVNIEFTVCNPGSGNSAGGFNTAVYDKDPTLDGTAKLLYVGTFPTPILQGQCETNNFDLNLINLGITIPNGTYYVVINDDGRNAAGGLGTAIGQPFALADLAGQNEDYIECDYSNNLIEFTISGVMACPTVDFLVTNSTTPTMTGTWDDANSVSLQVTANSVTYILGTHTQLTSTPNSGIWELDLSAAGLITGNTYSLEALTTNVDGTALDGTSGELIITDAGLVLYDLNGATDNHINGTAINSVNSNNLYVNIVDVSTGLVIQNPQVQPSGTYVVAVFPTAGNYVFQLSIHQGTFGNPPPIVELSGDFVYTAEGNTSDGDGTPDGSFTINVPVPTELPAVSFGIQQIPTSGGNDIPGVVVGNVLQGERFNPGVFGGFEMPGAAFGGTDDGTISSIKITSISSVNNNILYLTYGGIDYYRDVNDIPGGCGSCVDFTTLLDGISIPTTTAGVVT